MIYQIVPEDFGRLISSQPNDRLLGKRYNCWHCQCMVSAAFQLHRGSFLNMREQGLIPDGLEDIIPGPFVFCHNGHAIEFFWKRKIVKRLRNGKL